MRRASEVLRAINTALDVPEGSSSSIEELSRYFDPETMEYVITLQYRVLVPTKPVDEQPNYISPLIDAILDRPVRKSRRG